MWWEKWGVCDFWSGCFFVISLFMVRGYFYGQTPFWSHFLFFRGTLFLSTHRSGTFHFYGFSSSVLYQRSRFYFLPTYSFLISDHANTFYFRHPLSKDWSHSHQRSRKNQTTLKNQPFTFYQENLRQPYPTPPQKSLTKAQPPPQSRSRKNHRHTFKNLKPPLTLTLPHTHPIFTKYSLPLYNLN